MCDIEVHAHIPEFGELGQKDHQFENSLGYLARL